MPANNKLIYVVTEGKYFLSHRLPTVRGARDAGFSDITVVTGIKDNRCREAIEAEGIRVIPFDFERGSLNPLKAIAQTVALYRLYKTEDPSAVHHIAMKPILFGSLAAWAAKVPHVINAFAGLGYVFTSQEGRAAILRFILVQMFRVLLRRPRTFVLFQNEDDKWLFAHLGILDAEKAFVIRGSGVDLAQYAVQPFSNPAPDFICAFAGRMIEIKGLPTLQEAFRMLLVEAPHIKLWLCGEPDPDNPGSWNQARLNAWLKGNPNVVLKGHCADMAAIWRMAHLAVQPSYGGEGIPKALLEAAASGRAIVATDVPGCREMVALGQNGILVPPHDAAALAAAIMDLARVPETCRAMGLESRRLVEQGLSASAVTAQAGKFYAAVRQVSG